MRAETHHRRDISLFDTNGQHFRGQYEKHHKTRRILLIEFADREKSDHLAGRIGAPIGPGNTSCPVFSIAKSIADRYAPELMLDPALLIPEPGETYRYDFAAQNAGAGDTQ